MYSILLQAAPTAAPGGGGMTGQFIMIGLIFVVFYFFMIRPQMKKAKDAKKYMATLEKGTKVVTIGGIHGKIVEIQDTTFIIEVEGGNRLKIQKSAVSMDASASLAQPLT
ncbi:MAG TPA: preprotein translocase subunit YajC [Bacteroidia bacterium]|jgi:preprotein translocase subunit YajC|nr:preprotein translocase subunit YajC [Bacteroidia bacterium]